MLNKSLWSDAKLSTMIVIVIYMARRQEGCKSSLPLLLYTCQHSI